MRRSADGGVAEWLIAAVLKTVVPLRVPWVRIPPPPWADVQCTSAIFHFGGKKAYDERPNDIGTKRARFL